MKKLKIFGQIIVILALILFLIDWFDFFEELPFQNNYNVWVIGFIIGIVTVVISNFMNNADKTNNKLHEVEAEPNDNKLEWTLLNPKNINEIILNYLTSLENCVVITADSGENVYVQAIRTGDNEFIIEASSYTTLTKDCVKSLIELGWTLPKDKNSNFERHTNTSDFIKIDTSELLFKTFLSYPNINQLTKISFETLS